MRRTMLACLALLLWSASAQAQSDGAEAQETQRFEIRSRALDDAYRLVWPLLSERATLVVNRASRMLEVRDSAERLRSVREALAAFDVAPRSVRLSLGLIRAEKRADPEGSEALTSGVPRDVRELLVYNSFEKLGSREVSVREGGEAAVVLGPDERYRIAIQLGDADLASGRIELKLVSLERRLIAADGEAVYRPVLRFSEELASHKTRVLCATPGGAEQRALFVLLTGVIE